MTPLELLAPARNADIGIAAVDCGADAVYIAGPAFGARKDAGNPIGEIERLCRYAHKFGVRIFVTFNISVRDDELPQMHEQMIEAQKAGADAFIIRDERICSWRDITVPLHASTQCAVRDVSRARHFAELGCSRIVLERQLPLSEVRKIHEEVDCELEFFVHGALCVCYSGECRLSEWLDGRSGDRGDCIQACRSHYDLADASGKVLLRDKALLSLKDLNLSERLGDLADAGVVSFKIEGRLKDEIYVRNVVRHYSQALDALVASSPERYCRASFGRVSAPWTPSLDKTFNRGYTEIFLDGKRSLGWSSMNATKSLGEKIGRVSSVSVSRDRMKVKLSLVGGVSLSNGDGFAFIGRNAIFGFRGDICSGSEITAKTVKELRPGVELYRNCDSAFEKNLISKGSRRLMDVSLTLALRREEKGFEISLSARSSDCRSASGTFIFPDAEVSRNPEKDLAAIKSALEKSTGDYCCSVKELKIAAPGGNEQAVPHLAVSRINEMRRGIVELLDATEPLRSPSLRKMPSIEPSVEPRPLHPLMRSKYCLKYELGICRKHPSSHPSIPVPAPGPLYLKNNGKTLELQFDCANCEMLVI